MIAHFPLFFSVVRLVTDLFKGSNSNNSDSGGRVGLLSKMWMSGGGVKYGAAIKETLFDELYQEVRNTAPCAQLSCILRRRLERVGDKAVRSVIVSQVGSPKSLFEFFLPVHVVWF